MLNDPINLIDPLGLAPPSDVPPGVDPCKNISDATDMSDLDWIDKVRPKGDWDYKLQDPRYEAYGNYNYGLTGRARGWSPGVLRRFAGSVSIIQQLRRGNWPDSSRDWPWGDSPYGDLGDDQQWIDEGIKDYDSGYYSGRCECQ